MRRGDRRVLALGLLLAGLLTAGLLVLARSTEAGLRREALAENERQAREVAAHLDALLQRSEQLVDSAAGLAPPLRSRAEVERVLTGLLSASDPSFVYGVGIWYEPWAFEPSVRYFGPYEHRTESGRALVTYEWSTAAYDYPSQPWYRKALESDRVVFTGPYFDVDYVYVSATRAFTDARGGPRGVVSVDVVLPQFQRLILSFNARPDQTVYLATSEGQILAYPNEAGLLEFARSHGVRAERLYDLSEHEVTLFEGGRDRTRSVAEIAPTRWRVWVATDSQALFADVLRFRRLVDLLAGLAAVLAITVTLSFLRWRRAEGIRRELEESLRVAEAMRQHLRMRDEFLAVASHELRTPLTTLLACLQVVQARLRAGQALAHQSLDAALTNAERLAVLVEDLTDLAQVQAKTLELELAPTSLSEIVEASVSSVAAQRHGRHFELEGGPEKLCVRCDRRRLEHVLWKLLDNAARFSPAGGDIAVKVRAEPNGREAIVSVADRGVGIPAAEVGHLFERQFRSSRTPHRAFAGMGIGLYLAREIVVRHGGRIWAESTEGQGSTFFVALPVAPPC